MSKSTTYRERGPFKSGKLNDLSRKIRRDPPPNPKKNKKMLIQILKLVQAIRNVPPPGRDAARTSPSLPERSPCLQFSGC